MLRCSVTENIRRPCGAVRCQFKYVQEYEYDGFIGSLFIFCILWPFDYIFFDFVVVCFVFFLSLVVLQNPSCQASPEEMSAAYQDLSAEAQANLKEALAALHKALSRCRGAWGVWSQLQGNAAYDW